MSVLNMYLVFPLVITSQTIQNCSSLHSIHRTIGVSYPEEDCVRCLQAGNFSIIRYWYAREISNPAPEDTWERLHISPSRATSTSTSIQPFFVLFYSYLFSYLFVTSLDDSIQKWQVESTNDSEEEKKN